MTRQKTPLRRAFSLIDSMLAMLVLAAIAIVAMEAGGNSARAQKSLIETQTAHRLADSLLGEIMSRRCTGSPGIAASTLNRSAYTEIAQYHGLNNAPPYSLTGTALASASSGWRRKVEVVAVSTTDLSPLSSGEANLFRVTVIVERNNTERARRVAYRARD